MPEVDKEKKIVESKEMAWNTTAKYPEMVERTEKKKEIYLTEGETATSCKVSGKAVDEWREAGNKQKMGLGQEEVRDCRMGLLQKKRITRQEDEMR